MEFIKTTFLGHKFTLIFTGPQYILHSSYYGPVAVATREIHNDGWLFRARVGSGQCIGGPFTDNIIFSNMARLITKNERLYGSKKKIEFVRIPDDLNKAFINIEILARWPKILTANIT